MRTREESCGKSHFLESNQLGPTIDMAPSHMALLAAAGLLGMQACSVKGGPPNASSGRHWGCYSLQTNRFTFSMHAFSGFIRLMVARSPGVFACYRKLPACMWVGHCCGRQAAKMSMFKAMSATSRMAVRARTLKAKVSYLSVTPSVRAHTGNAHE